MDTLEFDAFLEHHGVRGMRWGIRRVRRNEAIGRAAQGNKSRSNKIRVAGNLIGRSAPVTAFDAFKLATDKTKGNTNLRNLAKRKFTRTVEREARIKKGKARIRDYIVHFGATRVTDLFPTRATHNVKSTAVNDKKVVLTTAFLLAFGIPVP